MGGVSPEIRRAPSNKTAVGAEAGGGVEQPASSSKHPDRMATERMRNLGYHSVGRNPGSADGGVAALNESGNANIIGRLL
jgi:hypothetical protein